MYIKFYVFIELLSHSNNLGEFYFLSQYTKVSEKQIGQVTIQQNLPFTICPKAFFH